MNNKWIPTSERLPEVDKYGAEKYYLLGIKVTYSSDSKNRFVEDDSRTFYECEQSKTVLVDYLREFQRKGK